MNDSVGTVTVSADTFCELAGITKRTLQRRLKSNEVKQNKNGEIIVPKNQIYIIVEEVLDVEKKATKLFKKRHKVLTAKLNRLSIQLNKIANELQAGEL